MEDIDLLKNEIRAIQERIKELKTKQQFIVQQSWLPGAEGAETDETLEDSFFNALNQFAQREATRAAIESLESCLQQKQTKLTRALKYSLVKHSEQIKALKDYLKLKQAELAEEPVLTRRKILERYLAEGSKRAQLLEFYLRKNQKQLLNCQAPVDVKLEDYQQWR